VRRKGVGTSEITQNIGMTIGTDETVGRRESITIEKVVEGGEEVGPQVETIGPRVAIVMLKIGCALKRAIVEVHEARNSGIVLIRRGTIER
jgi:hypothetical protein